MHHCAKFRSGQSKAICRFFKIAAIHHLRFFKIEILTASTVCMVSMRHRAKFRFDRSTVAEIWPFSFFLDGGCPPSRIS